MTLRKTAAAAAVIGLLGCAPLQQAPLVYSSKVAVGVDISSNAAESPGINISLGVKTVDAAYVPVAVSRKVESSEQAASAPEIIRISAQYGQGATKGDSTQLTESNRQRINAYIDARKAATDAADQKVKLDQQLKTLKAKQEAIEAASKTVAAMGVSPPLQPAAVAAAASDAASAAATAATEARNERDDKIQSILNPQIAAVGDNALKRIPKGALELTSTLAVLKQLAVTTTEAIDNLTKAQVDAAADVTAKNARADDLFRQAAQAASLLETSKSDAMSVYGRFDSTGGASVPGGAASAAAGSLLVGKVFSTGLASQNLTEAVKLTAVAACIGNALAAAGPASAATTSRDHMIAAVATACSANVGTK